MSMLYKVHRNFKDEFTTILNWSLMPTLFENAWRQLVDKYNMHGDIMMISMCETTME
jgi:hypothetical protein